MDILLKGVTIIDPLSPFHNQPHDLFIQNGIVSEIGTLRNPADETVDCDGIYVSSGWVDVFANFCDPGFEHRETLASGANAAAAGGFTDVFVMPNTLPVVDGKSAVEYVTGRAKSFAVNVRPIGAATQGAEGNQLAEMYDMSNAGAVAFGDGLRPLQSSGVFLKALQYLKAINATLIQIPHESSLSHGGLMNEGIVSTQLGMGGVPAVSEHLAVNKALAFAEYSGSKLHLTGISSALSLKMIREAKNKGIAVTCSVTPHHLSFTDESLVAYDANFKVNPPFRTEADRQALIQGLHDGSIDCVATHHNPQHTDDKRVEFEYAKEGTTGLETAFGAVRTAAPGLSLERLIQLFSSAARNLFKLSQPAFGKGQPACFTLFDPHREWRVEKFVSKSINSAFLGETLTGKAVGIINKDRLHLNR